MQEGSWEVGHTTELLDHDITVSLQQLEENICEVSRSCDDNCIFGRIATLGLLASIARQIAKSPAFSATKVTVLAKWLRFHFCR
jgi:hypothetical protein